MKVLPWEGLEIDTFLSSEAVAEKMAAATDRPRWWNWLIAPAGQFIFIGEINKDGFRVKRVVRGRNSFRPLVTGTFHATPTGTRVSVRMQLESGVKAFLCLWFGGAVFIGLVVFFRADNQPRWARLLAAR